MEKRLEDENVEDEIKRSVCEPCDYLADRHPNGVSTDGAGAGWQSRTAEERRKVSDKAIIAAPQLTTAVRR